MKKTCLIIAGGEKDRALPKDAFDLVIAVDKGLEYAEEFQIILDVVIGDFDSVKNLPYAGTAEALLLAPETEEAPYAGRAGLSEEELETANELEAVSADGKTIRFLRLRKKKEDPDTLAAVRYALKAGAEDLTFCCIMGGRFDHMLSNLQIAAYAAEKGAATHLTGDREEIHVIRNGAIEVQKKEGRSLSVFSLSDRCTGVSITGTLYPAKDIDLKNTVPLGLSNEWTSDNAVIRVTEGTLAVISSSLSHLLF